MKVDDLTGIARHVLSTVRLGCDEVRLRDDLASVAYLAGLQAFRRAESRGVQPARHYVRLAMQSAMYRELRRPAPAQLAEGACGEPAEASIEDRRPSGDVVEVRDALELYMPMVEPAARRLLERWVGGESLASIAAAEGIARATVWARIDVSLADVRREARACVRSPEPLGSPRDASQDNVSDHTVADGIVSNRTTENRVSEPKTRHDDLSHPCYDRLAPTNLAGAAGWRGGKNHCRGADVNGWASEFCGRDSSTKLIDGCLEVLMAEHTHLLLERLIAATETAGEQTRQLRLSIERVLGGRVASTGPDETPANATVAPTAITPTASRHNGRRGQPR